MTSGNTLIGILIGILICGGITYCKNEASKARFEQAIKRYR